MEYSYGKGRYHGRILRIFNKNLHRAKVSDRNIKKLIKKEFKERLNYFMDGGCGNKELFLKGFYESLYEKGYKYADTLHIWEGR